jgi:hypothetical protein
MIAKVKNEMGFGAIFREVFARAGWVVGREVAWKIRMHKTRGRHTVIRCVSEG